MHDESEIETDAIATDRRHLALDFLISSIVVASDLHCSVIDHLLQ